MRIVAALPNYPPGSRVGAWLATHGLLAYAVQCGHEVIALPLVGAAFTAYELDGVHVVPFMRGFDLDGLVRTADVVISHCGDSGVPARSAAKHHVPSVRLAHGQIDNPAALDGAALVVFNSHALASTVNCSSPWTVIHPPVVSHRWRTTPGEDVTLVDLSEDKGGELFWRLVRCAPHVNFLGVKGWGAQYVERKPNATVIDTTANMRDDVYARTRLLLMPSLHETWGMVGVEALASGIPVLAHPTAGLVESLGQGAIFVDRDDHATWLAEIDRLHDPIQWDLASRNALIRSAELDPQDDLDNFVNCLESIGTVLCG